MTHRAEDPVVEVSTDEEPCYEVSVGEAVVGPVTLDQVRRGRESGKIPDHALVREVGPWVPLEELHPPDDRGQGHDGLEVRYAANLVGPVTEDQLRRGRVAGRIPEGAEVRWTGAWMPVDEAQPADPPAEEPTDRKSRRGEPPTRQMSLAELQEAAEEERSAYEAASAAAEGELLEALSDGDLEEVPETVLAPPPGAAATGPAGDFGPPPAVSKAAEPAPAPVPHATELPTRRIQLTQPERDAVLAELGRAPGAAGLGAGARAAAPSARKSQPRSGARSSGGGGRSRGASSPRDGRASRGGGRESASSDVLALLPPFGVIALVGTLVIGGGLSAGAMARRHGAEGGRPPSGDTSPRSTATEATATTGATSLPSRPRDGEPLWSPCLEGSLADAETRATAQPVPCGGGTLSVTRTDGEVRAVLDGLARSTATAKRMPAIVRVVFPNLPPPSEAYTADRILAPVPALPPRPEASDLVGALRLWDAAARATADCRSLGSCRGAAWDIGADHLTVELGFEGQAMQLRFALAPASASRRPVRGRIVPDVHAWAWRDELPASAPRPAAQEQLQAKLVETEWLPDDAAAFLAAASRLGFKDDESTVEGLAAVGAWLRQSGDWGALTKAIWSDCIETRARKLRSGDRAAFEAFLGADPTSVPTLVEAGAAHAPGPAGRSAQAVDDELRQAFRAAIGTPAHVECAFRLETCRMAATPVSLPSNRVIRDASPGGAAAARKLVCQQRFGRFLAEELRHHRAPLLLWRTAGDDAASGGGTP